MTATLTEAGLERLHEAYPYHLASVRTNAIDHLDGLDLTALAKAVGSFATAEPELHLRRSARRAPALPRAWRASECLILGVGRALTREVPMDDPNDPYSRDNLSWNWSFGGPKWRPFSGRSGRGPRVPPPPWARNPPRPGKAGREQEKRAEARAERLHLAGLTNAAVIVMGVLVGAAVVMLVLVLVSHH